MMEGLILSFFVGLLTGPFSWGIIWFLMFVTVWEICLCMLTSASKTLGSFFCWELESRIAINVAAFLGWILGRYLLLG